MRSNRPRCFAAIDIGTNTIRSLVVSVGPDGRYRVLDDERAPVRLGQGMTASGRLAEATITRALKALQLMKAIAEGRGVEKITVVATSALRKAANREAFLGRVEREVGLQVRVISGAEEARLAFESAAANFDLTGQRVVVVDIGGGSTEVIFAVGDHIEQIHSLELGAVSLTEEYLRSDPLKPKEYRALRRSLKHTLGPQFRARPFEPQLMIASGGTASALAQVAMALRHETYTQVHGHTMPRAEVEHLLDAVLSRTLAERRAIAGLAPDRADILPAGIAILSELMAELGVNQLVVSAKGLRDGLISRIVRRAARGRASDRTLSRLDAAVEFARSCNFEEAHCRHVAALALRIFDRLAGALTLAPEARELLHAAALLHDVGYYISYARHHKHSYHLILHAELPGFTPREVEIIANVARYHRRAPPRKGHEAFARLPREDRRLVRILAAILRVADGLDRSHAQSVESLECARRDGRLLVHLRARRDASPEIWTARQKSALLAKVLDSEVKFRVQRIAASHAELPLRATKSEKRATAARARARTRVKGRLKALRARSQSAAGRSGKRALRTKRRPAARSGKRSRVG